MQKSFFTYSISTFLLDYFEIDNYVLSYSPSFLEAKMDITTIKGKIQVSIRGLTQYPEGLLEVKTEEGVKEVYKTLRTKKTTFTIIGVEEILTDILLTLKPYGLHQLEDNDKYYGSILKEIMLSVDSLQQEHPLFFKAYVYKDYMRITTRDNYTNLEISETPLGYQLRDISTREVIKYQKKMLPKVVSRLLIR